MLIFNTSFYVNEALIEEWKRWLDNQLFLEVNKQVSVLSVEVFEVISGSADENRVFSVQWRCSDLSQIQKLDDCVATILPTLKTQLGESVGHFSSLMKKL